MNERIEIKVPFMGEKVSICKLVKWHRPAGTHIEPGDLVVTLETKKVVAELEAEDSGTLIHQIREGDEVTIGQTLGWVETDTASGESEMLSIELGSEEVARLDAMRGNLSRELFLREIVREKLAWK
ncbi:lipoyl domain-containing protein [Roseibacillus ishigakijimensis]|uniref:Lipoyl-binding domain-containing protein n=1 Tax=Roseibacillus ishigakijimensis TaxID=454146 RepID=A0A934VLT7_9BACT|nr:biotin/lipoyl-containing protein [Roseibacillus ishigakijimensis]MBK1833582.1 hypothetical protein [Roseibacillus ishigakijimensis]